MKLINKILLSLAVVASMFGCDSDDDTKASADFASIASSYDEASGTGVVTIPLRNAGDVSSLSFTYEGTATQGSDYEVVGVTAEGLQIRVIDDNILEGSETVRITLKSSNGKLSGNAIHTLTILSNCEDLEGLQLADFAGDFHATEKYGPTPAAWYGPYALKLVQDEDDPTIFWLDNFYDSDIEAYISVDIANGTVHFPDQVAEEEDLTASSGTFDFCTVAGHLTLTISLNYDGGDWEIELVKD